MSQRLKITLPDPVCVRLADMAATSGEPVSRLAAQIVLEQVIYRRHDTEQVSGERRRPCWLAPVEGSESWRPAMWNAIVALYRRYPRALSDLTDRWWENESRVETLCALATWRCTIDESGRDPREELEFQDSLESYRKTLKNDVASATRLWNPDDPPMEWRSASALTVRDCQSSFHPSMIMRREHARPRGESSPDAG